MKMNAKLLISLACVSLGLTACSDDYFDQEAYDAKLKQAFPVDDVDPTHTWATMGTASATVTVNGDYGETYRVAVYQENPLYNKTVTLLTAKTMASGEVTDLKFSYPLGKSIIYFTCFDKTNHYIVKTVDVSEQQDSYTVNFFGETGSGARQKRSEWFLPSFNESNSNFGTRGKQTRATDYVNIVSSPFDLNTSWYQLSLSDEAVSLIEAGNYIGIEYGNVSSSSTCSILTSWNGNIQSFSDLVSSAPNAEYQLTADDTYNMNVLKSQKTIVLAGTNINIKRLYISSFSQSDGSNNVGDSGDSGDTGDGGGQQGGGGSDYETIDADPVGSVDPETVNNSNASNSSYSTFIKDRESKLSVSDWVNASWISNKVPVDVSSMGSSSDFATLDQEALKTWQNDNRQKHWWRIEKGTTLNGINQKICDDQSTLNKGVVYIKGELAMSTNDASQSVTWIVGDGGKLVIPQTVSLAQCGRIVVMEGGQVTIASGANVTFCGKDQSVGFYNAGDVTFPANVYFNGTSAEWGATLYNVGTMRINNVEALRRLYNFGTLYIDNSFSIGQNDGHSVLKYYFYNQGYMEVANGKTLTLAGAVNYGELNGTTLDISDNYYYNGGTSEFKTIKVKQLTNFGKLTFEENQDDKGERWTVNACYLHIKKDQTSSTGFRKLIMLKNSLLQLDGDMYFQEANDSYMEDKSLLTVGGDFNIPNDGAVWDGPSGSGEYAIVKIAGDIKMAKWCALTRKTNGAVYLDWAHIGDGVAHSSISNKEGKSDADAVEAMLAKMASDQISETTVSPTITIAGGDCTGDGYKGKEVEVVPPVEEPMSYRFCFEDNFPVPGDYDFNDCVITVTPVVKGKDVTLTVSLDGVGATKTIGAALRLVGISEFSDIRSASCDDDLNSGQQSGSVYARVTPVQELGTNVFAVTDKGYAANGSEITDLVVRLFDNAHYAISGGTSYDSKFYNTVSPSDPLAGESYVDNNNNSRTMTFTFEVNDEDKAQKFREQETYDVFIVENHNGKTYEVHTVNYKFDEVLGAYYGDGTKLTAYKNTVTRNYPWAVCVPHSSKDPFYYPREWWSISGTKIQEGQDTENFGGTPAVYPDFKSWAADQSQSQEWYKNPEMNRVFKLTNDD